MSSRAIPAAHAKLRRLTAELAARGGCLIDFAAVAAAIGLSPGRLTQLFGISNASAEHGIKPETLGNLARAFTHDGVPLTVDALCLSYDDFAATLGATKSTPTPHDDSPALPSPDWLPETPEAYTDLATLNLHPPTPLNSRPDAYHLHATLRLGPAEIPYGTRTFVIGLRAATLSFASLAYQVAHNSLIGERTPHDHLKPAPAGLAISGPTDPAGNLAGNPIGEDHYAIIEPAGIGDLIVTVSLHAQPRHFTFGILSDDASAPASPAPSTNKDALLSLVYNEAMADHRDAQGRLRLAQARLRRRQSQ